MTKRAPAKLAARRSPRFTLDVDWFIESAGCSTLGRGIELSVRGALLPLAFTSPFAHTVTLFVSLPLRERMFKAQCTATQEARGWVLAFTEVAPDDLQLLGHTLIGVFGLAAFPNLERRPAVELDLQKTKQYW